MSLLDLRKAYLQIHINKAFQTVLVKGKMYCLTQLRFGLNVALLIMKAIINLVMSQNVSIKNATSAYIGGIFVNEALVSKEWVRPSIQL